MKETAEIYGRVFAETQKKIAGLAADKKLEDAAWEEMRLAMTGPGSVMNLSFEDAMKSINRAEREEIQRLQKNIDAVKVNSPGAPPRAMVVADNAKPHEPRIFIRGNPGRPGEKVQRRFIGMLAEGENKPFTNGSGRLELAQKIVSKENPMTGRVLANRIWRWHMGQAIVSSTSDFGVRGEKPTHPELLDWLTWRLLESDWSIRDLHRAIVLSATYRQSSQPVKDFTEKDPENLLVWKSVRKRLDMEQMRDSILWAAGTLNMRMGGKPFEIAAQPASTRRTVYGLIDRYNIPEFLRIFDYPDPDSSSPGRPRTSVPQQSLYLMNSPFIQEQTRKLAASGPVAEAKDDAGRVKALYRQVYAREPDAGELAEAAAFLEAERKAGGKWNEIEKLAQVLLLSNEFMFVD